MSPFTRYSVILSGLVLALILYSLGGGGFKPRLWELNALLDEDPAVGAYAYDFRVLTYLNGIATITSPRASTVEESWTLAQIEPALADKPAEDPAWAAASQQLARVELQAIARLLAEPDVDSVVWALDRAWFHRNGVNLPAQAQAGP